MADADPDPMDPLLLNDEDDDDTSGSDEDDNRIENGIMNDEDMADDDSETSTEDDEDMDGHDADDGVNNGHGAAGGVNSSRASSRESHGSHDGQSHHNKHHNRPRRIRTVSYDKSLPAQHSYLGSDLHELSGRIVLDDDSLITIPLLSLPGLILVPGQMLPLQLQHPSLVSMMKKIIDKDRTFGLTSSLMNNGLGTTAEIRSFSSSDDDHQAEDGGNNAAADGGLPLLKVKAEGRQRFIVRETWRGVDGILMGKVKVLPDINLIHPFKSNCLTSVRGSKYNRRILAHVTPLPNFIYDMYDPEILMFKINSHLESWATFEKKEGNGSNSVSTTVTSESTHPSDTHPGTTVRTIRTVTTTIRLRDDDDSDDQNEDNNDDFDEELPGPSTSNNKCTQRITSKCTSYAPQKPSEFSYWVAANLPLEDEQRLEFLSLNCCIQRLRWLLSVLESYLYIVCINCKTKICRKEDVFCMSIQGPQGTYVNSAGYVHETLTVYRAESLRLEGRPSVEFSWFPGYAWSICTCSQCSAHVGWKFTATKDKKLQPEYFWGISRSSIELGLRTQPDQNHHRSSSTSGGNPSSLNPSSESPVRNVFRPVI